MLAMSEFLAKIEVQLMQFGHKGPLPRTCISDQFGNIPPAPVVCMSLASSLISIPNSSCVTLDYFLPGVTRNVPQGLVMRPCMILFS